MIIKYTGNFHNMTLELICIQNIFTYIKSLPQRFSHDKYNAVKFKGYYLH